MLRERHEEELDIVIIEGHTYDAATGEYLFPQEREFFKIDDEKSAEWFGERIAELDATVMALEARKAALCANIDAQIADKRRHREGMLWRYGAQLAEYAKANLPKGRRTYRNSFVSVAFRTVGATFKARDEAQALDWARENCPEAVKVKESFLVSNVPDRLKERNPEIFDAVPERETVKITTGVGE